MPSLFKRIAGLTWLAQLGGPQGPILRANGAAVEARDSTNSVYAIQRGAVPVGTNDLVTKAYSDAQANAYKQSVFVEVSANTVIPANVTFTDLLVANVTTTGGNVITTFTASYSCTIVAALVHFQLVIDGVVKRGLGGTVATALVDNPAALVYRLSGLAAGAHVVKIQARCTLGALQIQPVATVDEHASLLVEEVSV